MDQERHSANIHLIRPKERADLQIVAPQSQNICPYYIHLDHFDAVGILQLCSCWSTHVLKYQSLWHLTSRSILHFMMHTVGSNSSHL